MPPLPRRWMVALRSSCRLCFPSLCSWCSPWNGSSSVLLAPAGAAPEPQGRRDAFPFSWKKPQLCPPELIHIRVAGKSPWSSWCCICPPAARPAWCSTHRKRCLALCPPPSHPVLCSAAGCSHPGSAVCSVAGGRSGGEQVANRC